MTDNAVIEEALLADLPDMIRLCCDAVAPDVINQFLYDDQPDIARQIQTDALTNSLGRRFTHPTNPCHIYKATDPSTGDLVGWILVKWEGADAYTLPPVDKTRPESFRSYYTREVRQAWINILKGKPHVAIGALYVAPTCQRQGIGRQLVEFIYNKFNLDHELVIAQTRGVSEGFYKKLGWETASSTDVDLSEWKGAGLGYGLHRSPQMIRYPKVLNKGASVE